MKINFQHTVGRLKIKLTTQSQETPRTKKLAPLDSMMMISLMTNSQNLMSQNICDMAITGTRSNMAKEKSRRTLQTLNTDLKPLMMTKTQTTRSTPTAKNRVAITTKQEEVQN